MSTELNTIAAQEVKRRGVIALEEKLQRGPVHVLKRNHAVCVVLSEERYRELVDEAAGARLANSLADLNHGRFATSDAHSILDEIS
jgi:PHD/YefM family antitoxin component YafN of YafNO toxin-antitoxin module